MSILMSISISVIFFPELSWQSSTQSHAFNCMNPGEALVVNILKDIANFIALLLILKYKVDFAGIIQINKGQ